MADEPESVSERRPSFFSRLVRFFGMFIIVVGALLLGSLAGYYAAMILVFTGGPGVGMETYRDGEGDKQIAIIPMEGVITGSTAEFTREAVERILKTNNEAGGRKIGAVVLRVNSSGGGVTASDEIAHQLKRLREEAELPIVASYGGVAASGGYYASCMADRIYAQPTTITGSIGVVAPLFTVEGLLEKIGVTPEVIVAPGSPEKGTANNILRSWTEEDRSKVRDTLQHMQERFVQVVAEGRKDVMSEEQLNSATDGSSYTASQALQRKLIDEIGYLDAALDHARELGGFEVEEPKVVRFRQSGGLGGLIGVSLGKGGGAGDVELKVDPRELRNWVDSMRSPRLLYMRRP